MKSPFDFPYYSPIQIKQIHSIHSFCHFGVLCTCMYRHFNLMTNCDVTFTVHSKIADSSFVVCSIRRLFQRFCLFRILCGTVNNFWRKFCLLCAPFAHLCDLYYYYPSSMVYDYQQIHIFSIISLHYPSAERAAQRCILVRKDEIIIIEAPSYHV